MKKLLSLFLFVFLLNFIFAAQPLPHAFEGEIFSQDNSLTNGKTIIAELEGAVTGQAVIEGNKFKITVVDNLGSGGTIKFYIGKESPEEEFLFKPFEVTKTNLTFKTIPQESVGSCGDGICDANINECSFCAIDCLVSACLGNSQCDSSIGEDLVTAPNDCSICGDGICSGLETENTCSTDCGTVTTPTSDSPSSSSSPGGGSPSSNVENEEENNETTNLTNITNLTGRGVSINELNEKENETVVKRGISGWSIFGGNSSSENEFRSWIWITIILLVLFFYLLKKSQKEKKKKFDKKLKESLKKYNSKTKKRTIKKAPPRRK